MSKQTNQSKKNILLGTLTEGANEFSIVGYILYWNIRKVDITKEQFATALEECGIDKKYARSHSYRSSMIRALRSMEEERLVRLISEDNLSISYQFTAERQIDGDDGKELAYNKENLVMIDKVKYRETQDFSLSLVKCEEKFRKVLIDLFNQHKDKYKSSDITRYLQVIFREQADIVSLRPQGSVYFIPAAFKPLVDSMSNLLNKIGPECHLENFPIPNVESAKEAIRTSLIEEVDSDISSIDSDVEAVLAGDKGVSKVWTSTRIDRMRKLLDRIEAYSGGGIKLDTKKYEINLKEIEKKILGVRRLDLDDEEEETEPLAKSA